MAGKDKITDRYASGLQFRGKKYFAWDSELDGFGIRVWGEGSKRAFVVRIKRDGKDNFHTIGKVGEISAQEARQQAIQFRGTIKAGKDPRAVRASQQAIWTLDEAMSYFRGSYADARKLSEAYKADTDKIYAHHTPNKWKPMKVTEITHEMVTRRHMEISGGENIEHDRARGGSVRANAWLRLMSKLFHLPPIRKQIESIPTEGIKLNPEEGREELMTPMELATLWEHLETHENVAAAACAQFILLTGCRSGEAYRMRWDDIDQTRGLWIKPARTTKQRKRSVVTLTEAAGRVLGKLDSYHRSEFVFPSPTDATKPREDKLRKFWSGVRRDCAIPKVRIHDLRHNFGSWMAMGGVDAKTIGKQMGHADPKTTNRYIHVAQEHQRTQADVMWKTVVRAMATKGGDPQQPIQMKVTPTGFETTQTSKLSLRKPR